MRRQPRSHLLEKQVKNTDLRARYLDSTPNCSCHGKALQEGLWIQALLLEIWKVSTISILCYIDNSGLHDKLLYGNNHVKTKHIDAKAKWIKEKIEQREVELVLVCSMDMKADCLTKACDWKTNLAFIKNMTNGSINNLKDIKPWRSVRDATLSDRAVTH
ncbi:hypothetical protein PPACK8108_LOCUS19011 [Phakopsora pachyrhizi]|uniref:Uncharacterized protein n=1 Tax=Phakopsora pachyrhizi TaxID=170000 RepID=A0AAV0BCZ8_PHAPC|nr:hypothetical protein PPACK8108_LOCUS19011 [Phakopsora pachyrhizi]